MCLVFWKIKVQIVRNKNSLTNLKQPNERTPSLSKIRHSNSVQVQVFLCQTRVFQAINYMLWYQIKVDSLHFSIDTLAPEARVTLRDRYTGMSHMNVTVIHKYIKIVSFYLVITVIHSSLSVRSERCVRARTYLRLYNAGWRLKTLSRTAENLFYQLVYMIIFEFE